WPCSTSPRSSRLAMPGAYALPCSGAPSAWSTRPPESRPRPYVTTPRLGLPERIVEIHLALDAADIPHAFGGALALAWCTQRARGTIDIDLNLFVTPEHADDVLDALPDGVAVTDDDRRLIARDGQVRLWWDRTPVDVFFNTTPFHEEVA